MFARLPGTILKTQGIEVEGRQKSACASSGFSGHTSLLAGVSLFSKDTPVRLLEAVF